jgi:hypothetical protein
MPSPDMFTILFRGPNSLAGWFKMSGEGLARPSGGRGVYYC